MKLEPLIDVRTPLPAASCRSDKAKREEKQLRSWEFARRIETSITADI
jgi:hypothetical protein